MLHVENMLRIRVLHLPSFPARFGPERPSPTRSSSHRWTHPRNPEAVALPAGTFDTARTPDTSWTSPDVAKAIDAADSAGEWPALMNHCWNLRTDAEPAASEPDDGYDDDCNDDDDVHSGDTDALGMPHRGHLR